jgi:hypothetical protein
MKYLLRLFLVIALVVLLVITSISPAWAFCGFYVGGANAQLFNQASQVILAHKDDKTIITMANDYRGNVQDFALVVPVPVAIKREQVNIADRTIITKLDTFSQPRLVEYFDANPCTPPEPVPSTIPRPGRAPRARDGAVAEANVLGVRIEDSFQAGEYNILILSAQDSNGLETWLRRNNYQIPQGANQVLRPYIQQKMKFFVAKVNLAELSKTGNTQLRPLQIAYKSPKFMLPIRLGMLNAQGDQDLIVYLLSPKGRVQVTNYRTVEIPTNREVPEFVKGEFGAVYGATFQRAYEKANKKVAFLEYAWNVGSCDPCTTNPPDSDELKQAGVFWTEDSSTYITRVHVRYNRSTFPEDLVFQATNNQEQFQGRYIMQRPYRKRLTCGAATAKKYQKKVGDRQQQEAKNLAELTNWKLADIKPKIKPLEIYATADDEPFWPW